MPRVYERTSNRQSWSSASMERAIEAVTSGEMGWLRASKVYGVPQATLRRHAQNKNRSIKAGEKRLGRFKTVFPVDVERELVEHLKLMESRFFGLTRKEVLQLAYQLAVKNGIQHPFNNEKKSAGKDWLREFRRRNPDISLRKPEATSAARAQAFNRPQVAQFFTLLEDIIKKENIDFMKIYNVDESALSTVQRPQNVFATSGRKQVGAITSAERGSHVTIVCCMGTNGSYIPPALIFARKNMKNELMDYAPPGAIGIAQESGWMTGPVFVQWLTHFQKYAKASPTEKVLLIVDGHSSHKYLDALIFAKSALLREAYGKAATVQNAVNGFAKTGIFPLNADIFPDYMYEASETTNISISEDNQPNTSKVNNNTGISEQSTENQAKRDEPTSSKETINVLSTTVADLSPLPIGLYVSGQGKRKERKRNKTTVLNSTPNIEEAKEKNNQKIVSAKKKRKVTRKIQIETDSEEEDPFANDEEDDCSCIYCTEQYRMSKAGEIWLKCSTCKKWAHAECAGVDKKTKVFICEICTDV